MAVQPFSHLGAPALASSMAPLKEKKPALVGADARRSLSLFLRSSRLDPTSPRRARRVPGWTSHPRTVDGRLVFHRFPLYQQMVFHFRDCFGECACWDISWLPHPFQNDSSWIDGRSQNRVFSQQGRCVIGHRQLGIVPFFPLSLLKAHYSTLLHYCSNWCQPSTT